MSGSVGLNFLAAILSCLAIMRSVQFFGSAVALAGSGKEIPVPEALCLLNGPTY